MKRFLLLLVTLTSSFFWINSVEGALLVAQNDTSCGLVWGPIIQLSPDTIASYLPEIAVNGEIIHVIWNIDGNSLKQPYTRSTNGGLTFEPTRSLLTDSNYGSPPFQKIVANDETVFLFFCSATYWTTPVNLMRSYDAGVTWSAPSAITSDSLTQLLYASIKGDTVLIIHRAHYNSSLWKFTISTNGGDSWYNPQSSTMTWYADNVEISSTSLHRIYGDTINAEALYKKSSDLGETWSDSIMLSTRDGIPTFNHSLGIAQRTNPSPHLFAMWRDPAYGSIGWGDAIPFRESTDGGESWSSQVIMTDEPNGVTRGNIATLGSITAMVWETKSPSSYITFRYRISDDAEFSEPCTPAGTSPAPKLYPKCAITPSAFHVVWGEPRANGVFTIFYRRGTLITSAINEHPEAPTEIMLEQNYPNPFNPKTAISFQQSVVSNVTLNVYNIFGQEVATLVNERKEAGTYKVEWNAETFPSGLYFYRLVVKDEKGKTNAETKRMILMK